MSPASTQIAGPNSVLSHRMNGRTTMAENTAIRIPRRWFGLLAMLASSISRNRERQGREVFARNAPSWAAPPGVDLCSVLGCASGPHDPCPRVVVDLERLLNRPLVLRHVAEVHADPRPRRAPAPHRVHH